MAVQVRRRNVLAGIFVAVGGAAVAVTASSPLITVDLPGVTFSMTKFIELGFDPELSLGAGGPDVRDGLLASAAGVGVLGLLLVATTLPVLGILWRALAVLAAYFPALVCARAWQVLMWVPPEQETSSRLEQWLHGGKNYTLTQLADRLVPTPELYVLTAGLAAVAIGCLLPSRAVLEPAAPAVTGPVPVAMYSAPLPPAPAPGPHVTTQPLPDGVPATQPLPGEPEGPGDRPARRPLLFGLGALVAGLAVVVAAVAWNGNGSTGTVGGMGVVEQPAGPTAEERACVEETGRAMSMRFDAAGEAWRADEEASVLNRDGNPAYVTYATELAALDVSDCPDGFDAAFRQWAGVWNDYGGYLLEKAKYHAPWTTQWQDDEVQVRLDAYDAQVSQAWTALDAASAGLGVPERSWLPETS